jgi:putative oxidoreductase
MNTVEKGVHPADVVMLCGRLLLAWIFLHEGFALAANLSGAIRSMARLGVNAPLVLATVALQICAGISIAFGCYARVGALALAIFCVLTALLFHTNFGYQNEMLHFEKDLAIAGGMLALAVGGSGRLSLDSFLDGKKHLTSHVGMHPTAPRFARLRKTMLRGREIFALTDGALLIVIAITTAIGAYIFYGISIFQLPGLD